MQAGKLRHRVTIQRFTDDVNDAGESFQEWVDWKTRWANVEPQNSREYFQGDQVQSQTTHRVTIRQLDMVHPKYRLVFKGRYLNVESVIVPDERSKTETVLLCREET